MARKRKRPDWKQRCYRFRIIKCEPPQELWDIAKEMKRVYNKLAEMHEVSRSKITQEMDDSERKRVWSEFDAALENFLVESSLNWECKDDLRDRFVKACVAAAKLARGSPHKPPGWPRAKQRLEVSIMHRYTGGGAEPKTLFSSRSKRLSMTLLPNIDESGRNVCCGNFGLGETAMPFTMVMHRPIGETDIIKSVRLVGEWSVALQWDFYLVIQVEHPPVPVATLPIGRCAIDVGWRSMGEYYRVGMLYDGTEYSEIQCPKQYANRSVKRHNDRCGKMDWMIRIPENHADVRELQAARDDKLNECKARVLAAMGKAPVGFAKMGKRGLIRLHADPEADATVVGIIADYLSWDYYRHRIQTAAIKRMERSRTKRYETLANSICKKYGQVTVEGLDVKAMAEKKDKGYALSQADRGRQIVAPASFLKVLKQVASRLGVEVIEKQAAYSTIKCDCGNLMKPTSKTMIDCECGNSVDQDKHAAKNLFSQTWPASGRKRGLRNTGHSDEEVA
jgi:Putative transposase DNA-binding domain